MYITRHALANAGLEVHYDDQGLSIQGNAPIPEEVREHVAGIGKRMDLSPMDHDRLLEYVANITVWAALRGCPTEI